MTTEEMETNSSYLVSLMNLFIYELERSNVDEDKAMEAFDKVLEARDLIFKTES